MERKVRVWIIMLAAISAGHSLAGQDNSRNALDWEGIYSGILPCADCEGIKTDIDLHPEGTYAMARRYLGRDDSLYTEYGTFQWNDQGSTITFENPRNGSMHEHYMVGENMLIRLNEKGERIEGNLARRYILRKAGMDPWITDKYWKLIEIRGKQVSANDSPFRIPHLILWSGSSRVTGNAGCNTFTGSFELNTASGRMHFSEVASTQRICPDMEIEDELLEVIEVTDNYTVFGDTLSLNRARMAPLARFVAATFE